MNSVRPQLGHVNKRRGRDGPRSQGRKVLNRDMIWKHEGLPQLAPVVCICIEELALSQ